MVSVLLNVFAHILYSVRIFTYLRELQGLKVAYANLFFVCAKFISIHGQKAPNILRTYYKMMQ